jgi:hypothetical protein
VSPVRRVTAAADPVGAETGPAAVLAAVGAAGAAAVDNVEATTRQQSTAVRRRRSLGVCMCKSYGIPLGEGTIQSWRIAAMAGTGQDCRHA